MDKGPSPLFEPTSKLSNSDVQSDAQPSTTNADSPEEKEARYKAVIDSLPANPDDLLQQGWVETSHPNAVRTGHREFVNIKTGLKIVHDVAVVGADGFKGVDHYHVFNPNSKGNQDKYLDKNGHPTRKGANNSHILRRRQK